MTIRALYERVTRELRDAGVPDADVDARLLLGHFCGITRTDLLAEGDREWQETGKPSGELWDAIERRRMRIPLQHILGSADFMGLSFRVSGDVLIPRPDTELLAEEVLRQLHDGFRILDLCTGSGCILISLLRYSNGCTGVGTDLSGRALEIARENAERLLEGMDDKNVFFLRGDLYEALPAGAGQTADGAGIQVPGRFEVIVSNPPYIPSGEIESLEPEVREHDPRIALDGGSDGLDFYRRIVSGAPDHLCGGGMLFLEIGYNQAQAVRGLMEAAGFTDVCVCRDYGGNDRVICGTMR